MTTTTSKNQTESMSLTRFVMATLLCLFILGSLGAVGYSRYVAHQAKSLASPEKARQAGKPMPVRSEMIHEAEYGHMVGATAITEPSQKAIVRYSGASDPSGQRQVVAKVLAEEGKLVEKGEPLFEFGDEMLELVAKQKRAEEEAATAEFQGVQKLYERKAASKFELRTAQIKLESAKLNTRMAQRNLEASQVISPISGQLDIVQVVAGESIDMNLELTTVYKLDPIRVRVEVPQERVEEVELGSISDVVIDSFPHDVFQGTVISISPQVDPETRVLSAVIEVPNSDLRIKAGMSGFARFHKRKTALIVPDAAIVKLNGKASVFVVEEGRAKLREVRTGPLVETGRRVVEAGLSAGDEVVVYGQQDLVDNDLVNTDWKNWTRRDQAVKSQLAQADPINVETSPPDSPQ